MIDALRFVDGTAVVTATADFHPLRRIGQLTNELTDIGFRGKVLFDLLAVNGLAPNRFASMNFNSSRFDPSTFVVESEVDLKIIETQDQNAKNDPSFLANSVLSSSEILQFVSR